MLIYFHNLAKTTFVLESCEIIKNLYNDVKYILTLLKESTVIMLVAFSSKYNVPGMKCEPLGQNKMNVGVDAKWANDNASDLFLLQQFKTYYRI